jgi:molecular chaperone GrpE
VTQPPPEGRKITVDGSAPPPGAEPPGRDVAPEVPEPPVGAPPEAGPSEDVEALVAERDEYLDALQRLQAEFENYRKRATRDREGAAVAARRELASGLLPVMDNLERAVGALAEHGEEATSGVEMVRAQLESVLAGAGIEALPASVGEPFDPTVHEAIARQPTGEFPEGALTEVVQKGYRDADGVVRPARVVVATPAGPGA